MLGFLLVVMRCDGNDNFRRERSRRRKAFASTPLISLCSHDLQPHLVLSAVETPMIAMI